MTAGRYLVAAGAWSEALRKPLGWQPGIRPVAGGQIALLNTGTAGVRPLLLQGKRYIVPRGDGRVLVGSTEEDAGFDSRTSAAVIVDLLQFAASLMPSLAVAAVSAAGPACVPAIPMANRSWVRCPAWTICSSPPATFAAAFSCRRGRPW